MSVFRIIKKEKELDKLIRYCKKTGYCSFDYETSGEPYHSTLGYPTILGVSFQPGSAWIIPLGHFDSPFKDDYVRILQKFGREVLEDPNIVKVAWNLQFESKWSMKYGIKLQGILMDGMLAKYLLDENTLNGLKEVVANYLPDYADYEEEYEGSNLPWDEKPLLGLSEYCGLDCDLALRLTLWFESKLIKSKLYKLFRNMLMMGSRVLAESEFAGMGVDRAYLEKTIDVYRNKLDKLLNDLGNHRKVKKYEKARIEERKQKLVDDVQLEIEALEEEIQELDEEKVINRKRKSIQTREEKISRYLAGQFTTKKELVVLEPMNFASPKQLVELFYTNKRGFKFPILDYTDTGNPSTGEDTLEKLKKKDKSSFIKDLLNYRGVSKLFSTYLQGIYEKLSEDDRIHTRYLLHGTVTGRLSSRQPNLQNIPRKTTCSDIKPMFIAPKGYLLLQLDYSQAELRVMAAQANEESMLEWFNTGRDIHLASACKKFKEDYEEIIKIYEDEDHPEYEKWSKRRKQAKTINFGIIYGQGANKLSESLSDPDKGIIVTKDEAKGFLNDFARDFPEVDKFVKKQHKLAKRKGYVKNVFGRKRRLPDIFLPVGTEKERKKNGGKFAEAQRQSVNAPIQGAASDYTLFSSILIRKAVMDGILPSYLLQCFTVHDSLGFYIKPKDIHKCVPILRDICRNPQTKAFFGFQIDSVEMKVDFEIGKDWGNLKGYSKKENYTKWI